MKEFNNSKMASLNQISTGLIAEAMYQLKLAMGKIKDQKRALAAQANITKTWQDILDEPQVPDRDAPLGELNEWLDVKYESTSPLLDPDSPVVACLTYIYQMNNFAFTELSRSSHYLDRSKVQTLGPWAAALFQIILDT